MHLPSKSPMQLILLLVPHLLSLATNAQSYTYVIQNTANFSHSTFVSNWNDYATAFQSALDDYDDITLDGTPTFVCSFLESKSDSNNFNTVFYFTYSSDTDDGLIEELLSQDIFTIYVLSFISDDSLLQSFDFDIREHDQLIYEATSTNIDTDAEARETNANANARLSSSSSTSSSLSEFIYNSHCKELTFTPTSNPSTSPPTQIPSILPTEPSRIPSKSPTKIPTPSPTRMPTVTAELETEKIKVDKDWFDDYTETQVTVICLAVALCITCVFICGICKYTRDKAIEEKNRQERDENRSGNINDTSESAGLVGTGVNEGGNIGTDVDGNGNDNNNGRSNRNSSIEETDDLARPGTGTDNSNINGGAGALSNYSDDDQRHGRHSVNSTTEERMDQRGNSGIKGSKADPAGMAVAGIGAADGPHEDSDDDSKSTEIPNTDPGQQIHSNPTSDLNQQVGGNKMQVRASSDSESRMKFNNESDQDDENIKLINNNNNNNNVQNIQNDDDDDDSDNRLFPESEPLQPPPPPAAAVPTKRQSGGGLPPISPSEEDEKFMDNNHRNDTSPMGRTGTTDLLDESDQDANEDMYNNPPEGAEGTTGTRKR